MSRELGSGPIRRYVVGVTGGGIAILVAMLPTADWSRIDEPVVVLIAVLVLVAELFPITVPWRDEAQTVSTSTTWAFALVLLAGGGIAAVALAVASLVEDAVDHKPWWKAGFNAAQYTIALGAATAVVELSGVTFREASDVDAASLTVVMIAGLVFYMANNALVGGAIALAQGLPVTAYLRTDLWFQAASNLVLVSQAPLVVVASSVNVWLVPLFLPVIAAAWRMARLSVERERLAFRDQLTGLANRLAFQRQLDEELADARGPLAVALVDIDAFREVNDALGRTVGDRMLVEVARRLEGLAGRDLVVARVGGDEFAVFAPYDPTSGIEGLEGLVARLSAAVEQPVVVGGERIEVVASVGAAVAPDHGADADLALHSADVALRAAKRRHLRWQLYDPRLDHFDPRRLSLLSELRQAIARGELVPYFQPKAEVATRRVTGMEALVRWEHPTNGTLRPDEFLPVAEAAGLMAELTESVLDRALTELRTWRAAGFGLGVAVNFSPQSLQDPELPARIARVLAAHDLPGSVLTLELTETAAMEDPEQAVRVLGGVHALGVTIALDDYGTGHASLAWIKRLPLDEIKIDRSFVATMLVDPSDDSIVASTVEMAKRLGLAVTAEGVETDGVWERLRQCGCDSAQGYLLSRPMPPAAVVPWLHARDATTSGSVRSIHETNVRRFPGNSS
jgi:diguanylate cyclase (GGDEF)-like protein